MFIKDRIINMNYELDQKWIKYFQFIEKLVFEMP